MAASSRRVRPSDLGPSELDRWRELQRGNPALASPFFCPEFSLAVDGARADAAVTVIEEEGEIVAFFPFQTNRLGLGRPIGGVLSDHHGVIAASETLIDVPAMLRASKLRRWTYAELVTTQPGLHRAARSSAPSPLIDLSEGVDAYLEERGQATSFFRQLRARTRRLERDVGPLRFVARTDSPEVLDQLRAWKSARYLASGFADLFVEPWARDVTDAVVTAEGPGFMGMLTALYAGDHLVAAHLGMCSATVWHWWLPAYAPEFGEYSPGSVLLAGTIEHAPVLGVSKIDLGTGPDPYKARVANSAVDVVAGSVEPGPLTHAVGRAADRAVELLRGSPRVRAAVRSSRDVVERLRRVEVAGRSTGV